MSTLQTLRVTVAALMRACNENQTSLAKGLRLTQGAISRKQTGGSLWTLDDVDRLSEHYGIPVPDLLAGPTHAVSKLSPARRIMGGRQELVAV